MKVKLVRTVKRRGDLTQEQFKEYWLTQHAKLEQQVVSSTPGREKIVVSFPLETIEGVEPPWDGMVEVYFESMEAVRKPASVDLRQRLLDDEANFIDLTESRIHVLTEEHLVASRLDGR
ncbi:MAG: EthD family reductase [Dehalococcoidia bacterium]|nr:EthD family reductase [Dehalococcoidia bacterium]